MKETAKILAYFAAVIVLGALLAPPLFWAAHALAGRGIFPAFAQFSFQKYFNRAELIAAVVLFWPLVRWLRIKDWQALAGDRDPRAGANFVAGLVLAGAGVAALAMVYIQLGFYRWQRAPDWSRVPVIALSAVCVAAVEELLFRGAILGLLRRSLQPLAALVCTSALFAIVHFLKPDESFDPGAITWLSGFALIPRSFHQFAEPMTLLAGFSTLFALGWLLGDAALRTRALWLSIGLHAGVVFVKMTFSVLARRRQIHLPWQGEKFEIGLAPLAVLLLVWGAVRVWTSYENRARTAPAA